jgi:glycosyltransferase involved in cell wall biosynthesis
MRIVIAHAHLCALGGGERATLELLRLLGRRHEVSLWAGDFDAGASYAGLAAFGRRDIARWEWLTQTPPCDAVVTHSFGASLLALRHPRTICYIHTLRSRYLCGGRTPGLVLRRRLDYAALRRAARLATNSQYTAGAIERRYGRSATVVSCGVAPECFTAPPELGSYALYVGRLAPEKGIERLLRWSAPLAINLMVVGAGEPAYEAYLRGLAGPGVIWAGPLQGEQLRQAYARSRMLTFLPDDEEFGLVVLEAMASGRPVISVPTGGIPELVTPDHSGFLVTTAAEFAAAVELLTHDTALSVRLGQAGRATARRYSWERMADAIERLCIEAVETQPGRRRMRAHHTI